MTEAQTMILRFRDLVTAKGETIKNHKTICDKKGFVWWGWWSKSGETVPMDTFNKFDDLPETDSNFQVYLLDSGQKMAYKATCKKIKWSHKRAPIDSPDQEYTPHYYKTQKYLAWFKFTNIELIKFPDVLSNYSYTRVDEFFENSPSQFTEFYDKKICSAEELIQQNRSIWFIRKYREGDKTHTIKLLDSMKTTPNHFPEEYIQTTSSNLLWVSDLHYSDEENEEKNHHNFPLEINEGSEARQKMEIRITGALEENKIQNLGGVVVSGDTTWKASKEEYKLSQSFFKWMSGWGNLNSYQFAVCTGNHDLAFSDTSLKPGNNINKAPEKALAGFKVFYEELFYLKPNEFLSSGRKFLFERTIPVDICCLNSNILEQDGKLFKGHGFIGENQLKDAAKEMGWEKGEEPMAFRIVMVHHHLLPVTYREEPEAGYQYSVALDAEALTRWIVHHRVRLVLHGHMHQPFWSKISRSVEGKEKKRKWFDFYVMGMGSTGAKQKHLGEIAKNTFGLLKFKKHSVRVTYYTIHPINPPEETDFLEIPYECEYKEY